MYPLANVMEDTYINKVLTDANDEISALILKNDQIAHLVETFFFLAAQLRYEEAFYSFSRYNNDIDN